MTRLEPDLPEDGNFVSRLADDLRRHAGLWEKYSGGPGDEGTATWVAERMRAAGLSVEAQAFDVPFFTPMVCRLQCGDAMAEVLPQAPVVTTGATGITARLAPVHGAHDAAGAGGAIALIIAPYRRHAAIWLPPIGPLVRAAADAGARAIVIATMGPSGEAVALNAPADAPFVAVPTAILAPRNLEPLLSAAARGETATLTLDGIAGRRPTANLVGRLERGPRWLAFSTPRTGWFDCVGERGTGTAAFLALIEWAAMRYPDHSLFALNSGGHEYRFGGAHRAMEMAPGPRDTALWVHVGATLAARDMLELRDRSVVLPSADPQRMLMATEPLLDAAAAAFGGLSGLERPQPVLSEAGELSVITGRGYEKAFAVLGVHRWFHTREDTLDKVDARLLAPVVLAHMRLIEAAIPD